MERGIVLDQIAYRRSEHFPIMVLLFLPPGQITALLDGTLNDRGGRDRDSRFLQPILQRRIVVGSDGKFFILYQGSLALQFLADALFRLCTQTFWTSSLVLKRK